MTAAGPVQVTSWPPLGRARAAAALAAISLALWSGLPAAAPASDPAPATLSAAVPAHPPASLEEAREHLARARYEAAAAAAKARLALDEGDGDAWHILADALAARGRSGAALRAYGKALQHDAAQPLVVREAMARAPHDPAPRLGLAGLLLESYNGEEAQPLFEQALGLDEDSPQALLGLARSLHFSRSGDARAMAQAALERAPDFVPAWLFLARILLEDDEPDAAREAVERALAVNPRSVPALGLLAALHDRDGEDDAVVALMELVRTIAPADAEAYVILASAAADRRRYTDAVRFASRAVMLDASHWRAHALLGINRLRLGQQVLARRSLEQAFRGDPFNVWTKNTLDLLDQMDEYAVLEQGRFVLTARADHARVLAPYLFPIAEAAYDAHAARYGTSPPVPVRIEVHPRHDDLSVRTLGVVGVDLLGVSFGPTVVLDTPMASPAGPANWASVLWHELAHTFQLALSAGRAPRWLAEGMAVHDEHLARPGWGQDVGPGFLQAWLEGRLAPASRLNERFLAPRGPDDLGHAYLQAGLLVDHIQREHGDEALRELLRGFGRGVRSADLVRDVLGLGEAELDAGFDRYMQQRFGDALEALAVPQGGSEPSAYAALLRRGLAALESGALDSAEEALLEARRLVPGHGGASGPHRALVRLYEARNDGAGVVAAWREQVAVDADDLEAHLALAASLEAGGASAEAAAVLERALLISPFDGALHERLAVLLEQAGDWQAARRERAAVLALMPLDPVQARYRLALAATRAGELESARREVLMTLDSAPLFEPGLELLLEVRDRIAAVQQAEQQAEQAKENR